MASMLSDFPRSRTLRRDAAISRVVTRRTRSPRPIRNRSNDPETCRQSSTAQPRAPPSARAQLSNAANPRAPTWTVCSPTSSPVVAETAAIVCERLWASAPRTIITPLHLHLDWVDPRRTRLAAGAATLLSSHAGRPWTGDERHSERWSDPNGADSLKESQL